MRALTLDRMNTFMTYAEVGSIIGRKALSKDQLWLPANL